MGSLKWVVFAVGVLGLFGLVGALRNKPVTWKWTWLLIGFFPFLLSAVPKLTLSAIAWPDWPGYVKGLQISALDLYALALFLAFPQLRHKAPFRIPMVLYFLTIGLASAWSQVPTAAVFYLWQLLRAFFLYRIVASACTNPLNVRWVLNGIAGGLLLECGLAIWERFGEGMTQAGGSFGHQNFLGLVSHFAVFPFFALLLAGDRRTPNSIVPIAGIITWVATASRATLGLGGAGLVVTFCITAARRWTAQKARILVVGVILAALAVPAGISSLESRFSKNPLSDYDERDVLVDVAQMMLERSPLGVGPNNFTVVANTAGYFDKVPIAWTSRSAIVHNIYWLAAAETGYLGLAALVLLLAAPFWVAIRTGWKSRDNLRGHLLLGVAASLLVVYIHSYFEWIFMTFQVQYIFAITLGLIAGLVAQERARPIQTAQQSPTRKFVHRQKLEPIE
jgi:O-antigen ligase